MTGAASSSGTLPLTDPHVHARHAATASVRTEQGERMSQVDDPDHLQQSDAASVLMNATGEPGVTQVAGDEAPPVLHWYDFVCPFCYVGQHRTAILVRHGLRVTELPFQIHPEIPPGGMPAGPRNGSMYA